MEKPLPQNIEAERSVLGAILITPGAFPAVADILDPGDFFDEVYRKIFAAFCWMHTTGRTIDLVTLKNGLDELEWLDVVGGPAYISGLVDGVPRSTPAEHYAKIVKEKSTLRNLITSAHKILAEAYRLDTRG